MTRKETEVFLKDCPRLFSNFLNNQDFCLPYGNGWFDILHKCCLELEVLNKDGTYVIFEKADYIFNKINYEKNECGLMKFCVRILKPEIIYSSFHNRLEMLSSGIISNLMDHSQYTCENCGIETNKNNIILKDNNIKCLCNSCFEKICK